MPFRTNKSGLLACLSILLLFSSSFNQRSSAKKQLSPVEGFAVVELFTSEGCSSCPPADEAVGRLMAENKNIYILSFHVDYWNYLGWKDVYSNPSYSSRQREYGNLFHLNSVYTPQIVVNGKFEFVGSDENRLRETVNESLREFPKTSIQIKCSRDSNRLTVTVTGGKNDANCKLNIALVQNHSRDFIQRGENKGKTLNHYFTVRDFQVQPCLAGPDTFYLRIPTGVRPSECSIRAFIQYSKTGIIQAATGSSIF